MSGPPLEEVFKISGIPTYTLVEPVEYQQLLVALRTPGRGVVIEGPSGIGKTTAVTQALKQLDLSHQASVLSARRRSDRELIEALPELGDIGVVIVDDFHRLSPEAREQIADYLKVVADEETPGIKLVIVGINRAGEMLVSFGKDLNTRIETIKFEANPDSRVEQLITQGEAALNIAFDVKEEIVNAANGSFAIAQMLCHRTCLSEGVTEGTDTPTSIEVSFELVQSQVMDQLARNFEEVATQFARGSKLRPEGRAPYLHILKWLAEANEWSISLDREMTSHPELKASVGQVVDKGFLREVIAGSSEISDVLHYELQTRVLAVEDPQFVFFIRNLAWNEFAQKVGYTRIQFESKYDFALSFAGTDREIAERLFEILVDSEFSVFYDRNEQHRILAENIEDYLGPIYRSEASFVICLLGPDYPKRIWTKFESDQFKKRFGDGRVIPIWFTTAPPAMFDISTEYGGLSFEPAGDTEKQLQGIAEVLRKKIAEEYRGRLMPNRS